MSDGSKRADSKRRARSAQPSGHGAQCRRDRHPRAADRPSVPHERRALETEDVSSVIEPVDPEVLAARRAVILAKRRARRLAKPAYVNSDASWQDGVAGLAYVSGSLGNRTALVACPGSSEAEYLALLMAMEDADRCDLPGLIDFRVDSTVVNHLAVGTSPDLVELRARVKALLADHRGWRLAFVERKRNWVADGMARRTLKRWQAGTGGVEASSST
jgi:hypothetical protein